jgi:hypothetical protein
VYIGLQVKMVKIASRRHVQQQMSRHEYMFLMVSRHVNEHDHSVRMMSGHEELQGVCAR